MCRLRQHHAAGATANARKLLLLAKSMAQKHLADPEAAKPQLQSPGESAEAVRLYLHILKVASAALQSTPAASLCLIAQLGCNNSPM